MATNLKGQGGMKGFLLVHGEKIAIVLVAAIAVWFVYKSWKLPRLDEKYQAAKLQSEISQSSNVIKQFAWETGVKEHPDKVKLAVPIEAKTDFNVKAEHYVNLDAKHKPAFGFDPPIVAPMIRRTDPPLLNAMDVRATGGSGLFAIMDDEIRKQQELRKATEAAEREKNETKRQKLDERRQKEAAAGGPGGAKRRPGSGPEAAAAEVLDPTHPKRRQIESSLRPPGVVLQGGERKERVYWACVVAKVPIREQLKQYQDSFEKARGYDAQRDFPDYKGYYVQRAEVVPGQELQWKSVPLYDGQPQSIAQNKPLTNVKDEHAVGKLALDKLTAAAQLFWAGGLGPDVIDDRFIQSPLTMPLPPLVGREWGADVTHPDIPLAINTPPLVEETTQPTEQAPEQQPAGDPFGAANVTPGQPGAMTGPGAPPRFSPEGGPGSSRFMGRGVGPEGGPGSAGPGSRAMIGPGAGPEGGMARRGPGGGGPATVHTQLSKGVDYYLLRFFDFTVEPGKKYKYRVKLVLGDPNYNMPNSILASTVQDRQGQEAKAHGNVKVPFRTFDSFSEPSPVVGIPMSGDVRLAEAKVPPPEKINAEPIVKLLVEAFDVDDEGSPIQAATEKEFRRGYVANVIDDGHYVVDNATVDTKKDFRFLTGMTLLDVEGGTNLTRELTVPVRIVVMGPAGELYIRNETDDKPLVEYHKALFDNPNEKKGRGPSGPGGPEGPARPRPGPRSATRPRP
jgi:hypothetical protein